jgi:hypothetical protein
MVVVRRQQFANKAVKKTTEKRVKKKGSTNHPTLYFMLMKMNELYFDFEQIRSEPRML